MRRNDSGSPPQSRVLVHIGMHKTASSWLQEHLFGRPGTGFWTNAPTTMRAKQRPKTHTVGFYLNDRDGFLEEEEFDAEGLRRQLQLQAMPDGHCAILSNERLSGHPLSNGIDREAICSRLARVVPEARVLIVIREQRSMILSNYVQYLNFGGAHSIDRYLDPVSDARAPALSLNFWKYDRLIRLYRSAFGKENVLVLPYEAFVAEPTEFVRRVCAFAGIETPKGVPYDTRSNARSEYFSYSSLRLASPFLRSSRGNGYAPSLLGSRWGKRAQTGMRLALNAVVPDSLHQRTKRRLLECIERITGDTYRESNLTTQDLTGIDLGRYGYKLEVVGAGTALQTVATSGGETSGLGLTSL